MPRSLDNPPIDKKDIDSADDFLKGYLPSFEKRIAGALASIDASGQAKPKEAKGDAGRGASVDAVPSLEVEAEIKIKNDQIKQMIILCEGQPGLASFLPKLRTLLGTNPDDAELQLLDQEIQEQSKPVDKKALGRRRGGSAIPPDKTPTPDDLAAQQENDRILKQLFDEIPDGKKFSLKNNGGGKANYQREGNKFVNTKGGNMTGTLLEQLKKGTWDLEKPADISAPVSVEAKKEFDLPETGVEVIYEVDGEKVRITKVGKDLYEATFASGDITFQQNAATLREIAQNENWVLVSITPKGETINDAVVWNIQKQKIDRLLYKLTFANTSLESVALQREGMQLLAEIEVHPDEAKVQEFEKRAQALLGPSAVAAVAGVESAPAIEVGEEKSVVIDLGFSVESPKKSSVEELKTKVAEERFAYVTTDCKQDTAFKKLKRFFGRSIGEERGDPDTQDVRERYNLALTNLKEAELEQLKQSGLKGEDLKKEMVRLLNFFALEERVNLKLDRVTVEAEQKKWQGGVMGKFEDLGKWYNGLSSKQKLIAGALGLGLGGVALATGGTAVGSAAAGMLLFKRLVTTAGAKVAADGLLEQGEEWAEKYFGGKDQNKRLKDLEALNVPLTKFGAEGAISPGVFEKLGQLMEADIDSLDKKLQNQKRNQLWRRTATLGVAIAASSYFTYRAGMNIFGSSGSGVSGIEERQQKFLRDRSGVLASPDSAASAPASAASAPLHAASAPSGAVSPAEAPGTGAKPADVVSQPAAVPTSRESILIRNGGLFKDHVVTAADGKKGLWGVLQHRLPDDMPKADQNRIVASIENLMRKDLAEMTPAERAAAGFPKGDLDKIYAGKTVIHFDQFKSLTPERIQAILDGQSVGAPSGVAVETAHVSPVNQEAFENKIAALTYQPDMPHDPLAAARAVDVANYDKMGNVREYLSTHPEKIPDFRVSLGHFREEIFLTGDVQKIMDQDYNKYLSLTSPELGKLSVSQITRDYLALRENPFASYDRVRNPLHFSQMQQIDRLLTASGETYGAIGNQVPAGATIDDLTKRLATLGYQYQTGIPGFLKIKP